MRARRGERSGGRENPGRGRGAERGAQSRAGTEARGAAPKGAGRGPGARRRRAEARRARGGGAGRAGRAGREGGAPGLRRQPARRPAQPSLAAAPRSLSPGGARAQARPGRGVGARCAAPPPGPRPPSPGAPGAARGGRRAGGRGGPGRRAADYEAPTMVRCDRGLQMLLTTAGAFAAFSLMAIAIGTDYWLYSSAHICNGTNLTMDDGPAPRRARGDLTHSGLWRVCCIEGTAGRGTHPPPDTHTRTRTPCAGCRPGRGWARHWLRATHKGAGASGRVPSRPAVHQLGVPQADPTNSTHKHTPSHTDTMKHTETHTGARAARDRSDPEGPRRSPRGRWRMAWGREEAGVGGRGPERRGGRRGRGCLATGVCAIAMGTGHPGAGPAGGGERWGRSSLAPGPDRGVGVGAVLRAALGGLGRRSLTPPRPCSAAYSSTGPRPAAPCSVGREGCVTEAAPHPRLGEQVVRRGPSAGRLRETSAARQSAQGLPADQQLPGRGVAAPSVQEGRARRPTDARGGREVGVARLECRWGPGLGVPGPRGPLPLREGPGRLQWQNAPDFSASRPPRCGTGTNRWLWKGGLVPARL